MNIKNPGFLEAVIVPQRLRRSTKVTDRTIINFWQPRKIDPVKVRFLGWRWVSNGTSAYNEGHGSTYAAKERFRVALVVEKETRNPFYVSEDMMFSDTPVGWLRAAAETHPWGNAAVKAIREHPMPFDDLVEMSMSRALLHFDWMTATPAEGYQWQDVYRKLKSRGK